MSIHLFYSIFILFCMPFTSFLSSPWHTSKSFSRPNYVPVHFMLPSSSMLLFTTFILDPNFFSRQFVLLVLLQLTFIFHFSYIFVTYHFLFILSFVPTSVFLYLLFFLSLSHCLLPRTFLWGQSSRLSLPLQPIFFPLLHAICLFPISLFLPPASLASHPSLT